MTEDDRILIHVPEVTLAPIDRSPQSVRSWIEMLCSALNVSVSKLASMAEISHTTLNRFQLSKNPNKNLSASTIGAINAVVFNAFTDGKVSLREDAYTGYTLSGLTEPHFVEKSETRRTFSGLILKTVDIIGSVGVRIKQFGKSEVMWTGSQMTILLEPRFMLAGVYGFEMREENNTIFHRGDILICTRFDPEHVPLDAKYYVCSLSIGKHYENLLYACKRDPSRKFWLVPTWADYSPDQAILLGEDIELGLIDLDMIPFVVIASLRQEV